MKHFIHCIREEHSDNAQSINQMMPTEPRMETIAFIRQFAHVYQYEPKLGNQLGNYIVN